MSGRPKIKNKKENVCVYLKSEILEEYKKYCEKNGIENYSEHIEKLIKKHINKNSSKDDKK